MTDFMEMGHFLSSRMITSYVNIDVRFVLLYFLFTSE